MKKILFFLLMLSSFNSFSQVSIRMHGRGGWDFFGSRGYMVWHNDADSLAKIKKDSITFMKPIIHSYSHLVTTTDATVTTIATFPISTGERSEFNIVISGNDGSGNEVFYHRLQRVKNIGGTLTLLGSYQTLGTDTEDAALTGADISVTTSGTNILFRVAGIAATTIPWKATITKVSQ